METQIKTLDRHIDPIDPPDIQALSERIGTYRNGAYRLLMVWLAEPGLTTSQALKLADTSRVTYQRYRAKLDGFKGLVDYIRDTAAHSLKSVYAQQRIENAIPSLTDAMISRGLSYGKDSQRAGEKLLESAGVLSKPDGVPSLDGFDTLEIIAARLIKAKGNPA